METDFEGDQQPEGERHSKLPWRVRELGGTCFIEADKNKPSDPYNIEVMGDDTNDDLYPESQKRADAELIVKAVNAYQSQEEQERCSICGYGLVFIRGKYPKSDKRGVCPQCVQERLDQIQEISNPNYVTRLESPPQAEETVLFERKSAPLKEGDLTGSKQSQEEQESQVDPAEATWPQLEESPSAIRGPVLGGYNITVMKSSTTKDGCPLMLMSPADYEAYKETITRNK